MAMFWKYHIESDDLVQFTTWVSVETTDDRLVSAEGTVRGWVRNDTYQRLEAGEVDASDVEQSDLLLEVQSGRYTIEVPLPEITDRTKADDRVSDLPATGEQLLRWGNAIRHNFPAGDDPPPEAADEIRTT
jgi:hypothetical protein